MKNQKIADHYNKVYSDDAKAFSGEPLPLVKILVEYLPSGKILEIGAGAGRNSLFLAARGYDVRAVDISSSAAALLTQKALDEGVKMTVVVSDISEVDLKEDYDAIICTFTLHHLIQADAESVIRKIQQHTKPSGFNVLTIFTKNGDFFKNNPATEHFYLDNEKQLEQFYKGWKIIKSFEKEGQARALDAEGKPQFNTFVGFLAQRK